MRTLVVIPARWGSTRLPGKPLAMIGGKTLLERVVAVAVAAAARRPGTSVVVATDDQRIAHHASSLGQAVAMTEQAIDSGTSRAHAAAAAQRPAAVVNLQGDNPFTSPETVLAIIDGLSGDHQVVTPVVQLGWDALDRLRRHKQVSPFSGTTCVRDATGRALWFSKHILPAIRDEAKERTALGPSPVFRHLGLYGYTLDALARFCAAPPSVLEKAEGLEQLRFFELRIPIQTVLVQHEGPSLSGIDTPEDLELARQMIADRGEPCWT